MEGGHDRTRSNAGTSGGVPIPKDQCWVEELAQGLERDDVQVVVPRFVEVTAGAAQSNAIFQFADGSIIQPSHRFWMRLRMHKTLVLMLRTVELSLRSRLFQNLLQHKPCKESPIRLRHHYNKSFTFCKSSTGSRQSSCDSASDVDAKRQLTILKPCTCRPGSRPSDCPSNSSARR